MAMKVVVLLLAICMLDSVYGQRRTQNATLSGGGTGLTGRLQNKQKGGAGKGLDSDDNGCISYSLDDTTGATLSLCVSKVIELDTNKQAVCGKSKYGFDGGDPDDRNATRESLIDKEKDNENVNVATDMLGTKSSSSLKTQGTFTGYQQANRLQMDNMTVEVDALLKDNDETTVIEIDGDKLNVEKGDLKALFSITGHDFCGSPTRTCNCMGGGTATGEYLRLFIKVKDSSRTSTTAPPKRDASAGTNKLTKNVGSTEIDEGGFLLSFIPKQIGLKSDSNTAVFASVTIDSATWNEYPNKAVSGVTVDFKRIDFNTDTVYKIDPTGSNASLTTISLLLLSVAAILKLLI